MGVAGQGRVQHNVAGVFVVVVVVNCSANIVQLGRGPQAFAGRRTQPVLCAQLVKECQRQARHMVGVRLVVAIIARQIQHTELAQVAQQRRPARAQKLRIEESFAQSLAADHQTFGAGLAQRSCHHHRARKNNVFAVVAQPGNAARALFAAKPAQPFN